MDDFNAVYRYVIVFEEDDVVYAIVLPCETTIDYPSLLQRTRNYKVNVNALDTCSKLLLRTNSYYPFPNTCHETIDLKASRTNTIVPAGAMYKIHAKFNTTVQMNRTKQVIYPRKRAIVRTKFSFKNFPICNLFDGSSYPMCRTSSVHNVR